MAHLEVKPRKRSNWWIWLIIIIIIIAIAAYFFEGYRDGKLISKTTTDSTKITVDSTKTTTDTTAAKPAK
jgi:hypothetical protein